MAGSSSGCSSHCSSAAAQLRLRAAASRPPGGEGFTAPSRESPQRRLRSPRMPLPGLAILCCGRDARNVRSGPGCTSAPWGRHLLSIAPPLQAHCPLRPPCGTHRGLHQLLSVRAVVSGGLHAQATAGRAGSHRLGGEDGRGRHGGGHRSKNREQWGRSRHHTCVFCVHTIHPVGVTGFSPRRLVARSLLGPGIMSFHPRFPTANQWGPAELPPAHCPPPARNGLAPARGGSPLAPESLAVRQGPGQPVAGLSGHTLCDSGWSTSRGVRGVLQPV